MPAADDTLFASAKLLDTTKFREALTAGASVSAQWDGLSILEVALDSAIMDHENPASVPKCILYFQAALAAGTPLPEASIKLLFRAAEFNSIELLRVLEGAGLDMLSQHPLDNKNALLHAVWNTADASHTKEPCAVDYFLSIGIPVDSQNSMGNTALRIAVVGGKYHYAHKLLLAGADLNLKSLNNETPMEVFWRLTYTGSKQYHLLSLLLQKGGDANSTDALKNKWTGLMLAATKGDLASVRFLLAFGANPLLRCPSGFTARQHLQKLRTVVGPVKENRTELDELLRTAEASWEVQTGIDSKPNALSMPPEALTMPAKDRRGFDIL